MIKTAYEISLGLTPDPFKGQKIKPDSQWIPLKEYQKLEQTRLTQLENHNRTMDEWRQNATRTDMEHREETKNLKNQIETIKKILEPHIKQQERTAVPIDYEITLDWKEIKNLCEAWK